MQVKNFDKNSFGIHSGEIPEEDNTIGLINKNSKNSSKVSGQNMYKF